MNSLLFSDEAKNNWLVLSAAIECPFVENSLDLTGRERGHDEDKAWWLFSACLQTKIDSAAVKCELKFLE